MYEVDYTAHILRETDISSLPVIKKHQPMVSSTNSRANSVVQQRYPVYNGILLPSLAKPFHISSSLATDTTGQLDVLGHDGDTLGMDRTQVCVLKKTNQECFGSFLKSKYSS